MIQIMVLESMLSRWVQKSFHCTLRKSPVWFPWDAVAHGPDPHFPVAHCPKGPD